MSDNRLFKILYALLEKGRATAPDLAAELGVSTRTIYRDIDALNDAGIPVCSESGRNGGVYLSDDFLSDTGNTPGQTKEKLLGTLRSMSTTGLTLEKAFLTKLPSLVDPRNTGSTENANTDKAPIDTDSAGNTDNAAAPPQPEDTSWLQIDFSRWGNNLYDNQKFELLKEAVIKHRLIQIAYLDSPDKKSDRKVQPLKLYCKAKEWYLKGFCMEQETFRMFQLGRILKAEILDETFTPQPYTEEPVENPVCHKIQLAFSKKSAFRVYAEFEPDRITERDNGDLLVTANLPTDAWLIEYLLSFGPQVEVLEPKYLQKLLSRQAQSIFEKYKA